MSGEDSGDIVENKVKAKIDAKIVEEGFVFYGRLESFGNYLLYFNQDKTIRRTYHPETGELVEEGVVGSNKKGLKKFLNPEEVKGLMRKLGIAPTYSSRSGGKWR